MVFKIDLYFLEIFFTQKVAKKLEGANDLELRKLRKKVDEAKIKHDDMLAQVSDETLANNRLFTNVFFYFLFFFVSLSKTNCA